ncbi:MAG: flagellar FliJ family protein, partial [Bacillota bacterium]
FRLERILRLRRRLCAMEEMRFRRANMQRRQSEAALQAARTDLQRNTAAILESGQTGCQAQVLHRRWWHRIRLEAIKSGREEDLREKERLAEQSRMRLQQARQKREVLDRLREQADKRARMQRRRKQQKVIDDVASTRYVREGGDSTSEW